MILYRQKNWPIECEIINLTKNWKFKEMIKNRSITRPLTVLSIFRRNLMSLTQMDG